MLPQDLTIGHTKLQSDEENEDDYKVKFLQSLKIAYEKVKNVKEKEQEKYKTYYDKTHKDVQFIEGDLVWVYFRHPEKGKTHKLLP